MKRLLVILITLIVGFSAWYIYRSQADRFFAQYHVTALSGGGGSMLPTMPESPIPVVGYRITPIEGDIISFQCSKPECAQGKSGKGGMTKRLITIREDGAWWVLGDNRAVSHDSGDFGWLMPSEISDVWVIKLQ